MKYVLDVNDISQSHEEETTYLSLTLVQPYLVNEVQQERHATIRVPYEDYKKLQGWPELGEILFKKCEITLQSEVSDPQKTTDLFLLYLDSFITSKNIDYQKQEKTIDSKVTEYCSATFSSLPGAALQSGKNSWIGFSTFLSPQDFETISKTQPFQPFRITFKFI